MEFIYTKHAEKKINERELEKGLIERALGDPDEIVETLSGKLIAHKIVGKKLLRIVHVRKGNSYIIITVYYTMPFRYMVKK